MDNIILGGIIRNGILNLNMRGLGTVDTPGVGQFAAIVTAYMSARELVHQAMPNQEWNLTGTPRSFASTEAICKHAVRNARNLVASKDQLVGLYTFMAGTTRHFMTSASVGLAHFRTVLHTQGNPNRVLHTPYLMCLHCKQCGGTTSTPNTAWH